MHGEPSRSHAAQRARRHSSPAGAPRDPRARPHAALAGRRGSSTRRGPRSGRQPIIAFWHGRILPATATSATAASSSSRARTSTANGSRGSSTGSASGPRADRRRAAARARWCSCGATWRRAPAAFTLDGPRGPARVAQPGAVWLAGATGNPLLPFHFEASRFWTMRSWDRTQIPKPFARVALTIGEPVTVEGTTEPSVDAARLALEDRLRRLEERRGNWHIPRFERSVSRSRNDEDHQPRDPSGRKVFVRPPHEPLLVRGIPHHLLMRRARGPPDHRDYTFVRG